MKYTENDLRLQVEGAMSDVNRHFDHGEYHKAVDASDRLGAFLVKLNELKAAQHERRRA